MKLFRYSRWGLAPDHWYQNLELLVARGRSFICLILHYDGDIVPTGPSIVIAILRGNSGLLSVDIDVGPWLFSISLLCEELEIESDR